MHLNEYQEKAMSTCLPTSENWEYMFTGLVGEVGELASKVAKAIRKGQIVANDNDLELRAIDNEQHKELSDGIKGEISDCAWFIAGLCQVFGFSLEEVCQYNLDKLASRKKRGVIEGNGDNR